MPESFVVESVENLFSAVSERRMSQIMSHGDGFSQILIQRQSSGNRPGDLRHLYCMSQTSPVVVSFRREKYLSLVHESAEGLGVDDSVPVSLEVRPDFTLVLKSEPAS